MAARETPPFHAEPLQVRIDPAVIEDLRARVRHTRLPAAAPGDPWAQGTDRDTLLAQVKLIVSTPALRERQWAGQLATQQVILQALQVDQLDPHASFQAKVTVAACLAAASTAVLTWVENDGTPELPDLIEQAFDTLTRPQ